MFQPFSFGKGFGSFEEFIIDAEALGLAGLGGSVSISGNGSIIAASNNANSKAQILSGRDGSIIRSINEPDPANSIFAFRVAISKDGSTLVASDPQYPSSVGTVYVFNVADGTLRSTVNNINPSLATNWGSYNLEVNSDGSIVQVPVPLWTYAGGQYRGRVYQFNTSDASFEDRFGDDSDPGISDINFAFSSDMSGDGSIIVSGALDYNSSAGGAYVYFKSSGIYKFVESLAPSSSYNFGYAVSMSEDGTRLLISEPQNGRGKVYLYDVDDIESSFGSTASPILTISNPNTADGSSFGVRAKLSGDGSTIMVGDTRSKVYVFNSSDGSLRRTLTVQDLDPGYSMGTTFGYGGDIDLSYNGKRAAIGVPDYDSGSFNFYGGIFMFNV